MSDVLLENWQNTKEVLMDGLSGTRATVMSTVLENTRQALTEAATSGTTSAGNIASINKVILPIIRRVMPTVIANEIVGVQPMTGPVGQIHTLRTRYSETYASATAGDEALSPFFIARGYSGDGNATAGSAAPTATLEGVPGRRMDVHIVKQTVEAKSRRLSANWTFEAAQDAQSMHGLDIEAEIMAVLANSITAEVDQEILHSLMTLAGTSTLTYDQSAVSGTATFVGDEHAAFTTLVNKAANDIGARTRLGVGNWMIVSPTMLTILQSATTSAFARTTEGPFEGPTNTKFVGTLNNTMRVYVNQLAANDNVLVGYKGQSETDAPAFYCPYIPLMSSGTVLDPTTMTPIVSFMTRYGYVELSNQASSLGNAADYLSKINVTTSSLSYT